MRRGKYYDQPKFPFVPGYDLVGVVEALDGGPAPVAVGQSFAGAPVQADPAGMGTLLDSSLQSWLTHLKSAAEGRS